MLLRAVVFPILSYSDSIFFQYWPHIAFVIRNKFLNNKVGVSLTASCRQFPSKYCGTSVKQHPNGCSSHFPASSGPTPPTPNAVLHEFPLHIGGSSLLAGILLWNFSELLHYMLGYSHAPPGGSEPQFGVGGGVLGVGVREELLHWYHP